MSRRIGFFAGAFDPIHDGHLEVARSAVTFLELDKLHFMVEAQPWTAKQPVLLQHRRAMVDIATQDIKKVEQLKLDDERFNIQTTLPKLKRMFPGTELYFVFGADVFMQMSREQWPGLEQLLKHYIVVFERAEITEKHITQHAKQLGIVVAILPSKHLHHSSSAVRMQPHEKKVWVSQAVADYIHQHRLYTA